MHRLFDPLLADSATRGAGLDWKTSLQELTAAELLGVPDYLVEESGPDHQKHFMAVARVAGRSWGDGEGNSKKEAEQRAAEAAWGAIRAEVTARVAESADTPIDGATTPTESPRPDRCLSCPRSRPYAAASSAPSSAAPIASVEVLHDRAVRRHVAGRADFAGALTGRTLLAARRRGKYLWLPLDSGDALVDPPGHERPAGRPRRRRCRTGRTCGSGCASTDGGLELRFVDQRTFGGMQIDPGRRRAAAPARAHRPRPVRPALRRRRSSSGRSAARRTGIKRALLDQTVVSGIGNMYADEALWRARLHYARPTAALTRAQARALLAAAREVMTEALAAGGTTFDGLTSTSTARAATSTSRSTPTAGRASRATAAGR